MWVIGAIIAATGMQVYIVWGSALPRNGGEKNYLEYLFRYPRFLVSCMFGANAILLAWAAGNSLVFGEYILLAAQVNPTRWTLRLVGFACVTFAVLIHGTRVSWGLRLQNFLGVFKILVLLFIVVTGFVALGGHVRDFEVGADGLGVVPIPGPNGGIEGVADSWRTGPRDAKENFRDAFAGTKGSASSFCLSLYNVRFFPSLCLGCFSLMNIGQVIWSYIGFSNVNYALSEVKNPQRTVRIAGPLAIAVVTVLYLLANIAYFAGATKEEITGSGRLVAALLFRNVYGPKAERALSVFVAMSALGNVLSVVCFVPFLLRIVTPLIDIFLRCRFSLRAESTKN